MVTIFVFVPYKRMHDCYFQLYFINMTKYGDETTVTSHMVLMEFHINDSS